jgi:broad specificity phosphatase PhoE
MSRKPQPVAPSTNPFAALASDSEDEGQVQAHEDQHVQTSKPSSPPFRVWSVDDSEKRFKPDTNIFSSPFSRKKGWAKPRFKEDGEGWVSIEIGKPTEVPAVEEKSHASMEDFSLTAQELAPQDFPSMLNRGDQETAAIWAEKVKKSLDRAEKVRVEFKRGKDNSSDIGTRLSFFRGATV